MGNKIITMDKYKLEDIVEKSHPYIKEVIKIYGEQGCEFEICSECRMILRIYYPKGRTVAGPILNSFMYCRHRMG